MIIAYHADCIDGAATAWTIGLAQTAHVTYIPYDHGDPQGSAERLRAALADDTAVCFADVTPEKEFLAALLAAGKKVEILDHHESAAAMLKNITHENLAVHLDPAAPSAAKMTWQHFFPDKKPPAVIDLIDRMDGSGAGLKTAEDFAAAAYVDTKNIHKPERALKTLRGLATLSFNEMAKRGAPLTARQNAQITHLLNHPATVRLQLLPGATPVDVPIVKADIRHYGRPISSRLTALGARSGAGVVLAWFVQKTGAVSVSIRTNGQPDASRIAAHLRAAMPVTGGGHKDAAAVHFASVAEFTRYMPIKPGPKPPAPPTPV